MVEEEVLYIPGPDDMNIEHPITPMEISNAEPRVTRQSSLKSQGNLTVNHGSLALNTETEMGNFNIPHTKRFRCVICKNKTRWHCLVCHANLCDNFSSDKDCVDQHILEMKSKLGA